MRSLFLWAKPTKGFILKYRFLPLAHLYKVKGRQHFPKWGTLGTFWGTCQELGNSLLWPPPPLPSLKKKESLDGKLIVQKESEQYTIYFPHQTQLEKKLPPSAPHPPIKRKKKCPFTPQHNFSLVAWKLYFKNWLPPFLAWTNSPIIRWGFIY